ncbi:MAG: YHYH domain-containing protein [Gammaproteobacteria bacterium]|nr:YHYH domain-containing protein [Gammaproteobacteria bacterium]
MLRITFLLMSLYAATASAHGGGLDSNGGHNNRKTGEYHCHREPCLSTQQQVQSATKEATNSRLATWLAHPSCC